MDAETNLRVGWIIDAVDLTDEQEDYILAMCEEADTFDDLSPDVKMWLASVESEEGIHPDYQQVVSERAQQILKAADGEGETE